MVTWQFWTLIGALFLLFLAIGVAADKICAKLDTLNWTLSDIRSQHPELLDTVLRLPEDIADQIDVRK